MTRRSLRFRPATLMILIGVVALGLGGYRWYQSTVLQRLLDRAGAVLREIRPETDLTKLDARLVPPSGGGADRQVQFRHKITGEITTVTIPLVDPGSGPDDGFAFVSTRSPSNSTPSPIGHFEPAQAMTTP